MKKKPSTQQTLKLSGHTPRDKQKNEKKTNNLWRDEVKTHQVLCAIIENHL